VLRNAWRGALLLAIAATALAAAAAWYEMTRPRGPAGATVIVRVGAGSSARTIARDLIAAGVSIPPWEFVLAAEASHASRSLRAGRYRLEEPFSLLDLIGKFRRGEVEREQITVLEGSTFAQMRETIGQSPEVRHDTAAWSDAQILHALGADGEQSEGMFAPDTYVFDPGSSDVEVFRQAHLRQRQRLEQAWQQRASGLPYARPYDALIMASIIEKETGRPEERRQVAAVFVNRQRLGMALQTDPTVIYGLGSHFDGRLHKRDLTSDTPYNTYTRAGLPPTPICLPGQAAIDAALNPDPGRILYFVARGDGTSEFSETLAAHNRAVDRFQKNPPRRARP
jgi:UPF0755 protein